MPLVVPVGSIAIDGVSLVPYLESEDAPLVHEDWESDSGDDEMGRPFDFRLKLRGRGERYLLAVPSNTWVRRRPPSTTWK